MLGSFDHDANAMLREAVLTEDVAAMRRAIKNGANPNSYDESFWTPLHLAARYNQADRVIHDLLISGASVTAKTISNCLACPEVQKPRFWAKQRRFMTLASAKSRYHANKMSKNS